MNLCFPKKGIKIINRSSQSILPKNKEEKPREQNVVPALSTNFQINYPQQTVSTSRNTTARSATSNPYQYTSLSSKYSEKQNGI